MCDHTETPELCFANTVPVKVCVFPRLLGRLHGPLCMLCSLMELTSFGQMAFPEHSGIQITLTQSYLLSSVIASNSSDPYCLLGVTHILYAYH